MSLNSLQLEKGWPLLWRTQRAKSSAWRKELIHMFCQEWHPAKKNSLTERMLILTAMLKKGWEHWYLDKQLWTLSSSANGPKNMASQLLLLQLGRRSWSKLLKRLNKDFSSSAAQPSRINFKMTSPTPSASLEMPTLNSGSWQVIKLKQPWTSVSAVNY